MPLQSYPSTSSRTLSTKTPVKGPLGPNWAVAMSKRGKKRDYGAFNLCSGLHISPVS